MNKLRLLIRLRLVILHVRPHHHRVAEALRAIRKLKVRLVSPLRETVLLLVALARSVILPQGAAGEGSSA